MGDRGNVTRPFAEERQYIRVAAEGGGAEGRGGRGEARGTAGRTRMGRRDVR